MHTSRGAAAATTWTVRGDEDADVPRRRRRRRYYKKFGEPLFSSHMLDLSEEPDDENIEICAKYFAKMAKIDLFLEMEIGITGGEEDGVNNEDVDPEKLYTTPEQVWAVYEALSKIGPALRGNRPPPGSFLDVYASDEQGTRFDRR